MHFWNESYDILIQVTQELVPVGPIRNKSGFGQWLLGVVQATSHRPNQRWPGYLTLHAITKPE